MADSYVCSGAQMQCSLGNACCVLQVLPNRCINLCATPMANIDDHKSKNIPSFGLCFSTAIPTPCTPIIPFPWENGKYDYLLRNQPALLKTSTCHCLRGGIIRLITDGQEKEGTQWIQKLPHQTFPKDDGKKYKIVLKDAYWKKDILKIRVIPHQMEQLLIIVFTFEEDENGKSKSETEFKLKFEIPGTILPSDKVITIKGEKLRKLRDEEDNFVKDTQGNFYYYYEIRCFSSDLTKVKFDDYKSNKP